MPLAEHFAPVKDSAMRCLNLGCGNRFISGWTNVDFVSQSSEVLQHDLTKGIPFDSNSFDIVYHSHVLEHFSKHKGSTFISECYRVLVPGGHIRVAVPDLEMLARLYLKNLEAATQDQSELRIVEHQWSTIELLDQMVRTKPGGEMLAWWSQDNILNAETVKNRVGYEFTSFRSRLELAWNQRDKPSQNKRSLKHLLKAQIKRVLEKIMVGSHDDVFRNSGEIHQWMYDHLSLKLLLAQRGFENIVRVDAFTTTIEDWGDYSLLDQEAGEVRKPDSLFLEGRKPRGNA